MTSGVLPTRLHGSIVSLSPSTVWNWSACRRRYLLRNLVALPRLDDSHWSEEGRWVHGVLHELHRDGSCHDGAAVTEVVDKYGGASAERLVGFIQRHAARCPQSATYLGGEIPLARLHRQPPPVFTASGTIDAAWIHDGMLDARDYKTGAPSTGEVADDVRARVQAWLLAPLAADRGLALRLRYEFLAPEAAEDPMPFAPDAEQLAGIEEELRGVAEAMRDEREFAGIADPAICRTCEYRSVCSHARLEDEARDVDGTE